MIEQCGSSLYTQSYSLPDIQNDMLILTIPIAIDMYFVMICKHYFLRVLKLHTQLSTFTSTLFNPVLLKGLTELPILSVMKLSPGWKSSIITSNKCDHWAYELLRPAACILSANNCRSFLVNSYNEVYCLVRILWITRINLITSASNMRENNAFNYYNSTYNYMVL